MTDSTEPRKQREIGSVWTTNAEKASKKRIGKGLYGYFQLQKPKKLKAYGQRMRQERGPLRTLRRPSISAITSINRSRNPSPLRLTLFSFTVKVIFYYQIRVILPYYHKVLFLWKDR